MPAQPADHSPWVTDASQTNTLQNATAGQQPPSQVANGQTAAANGSSGASQTHAQTSLPATAAEAYKAVNDMLNSGDRAGAAALSKVAREQWPDDKNLLAFDKLTNYHHPGFSMAKAGDWTRKLLDGIAFYASVPGGGAATTAARVRAMPQGSQAAYLGASLGLAGGSGNQAVTARAVLTAMQMRDFSKLENQMNSLLAKNPSDYRSYRSRALARWRLGRPAEAVSDAKKAVQLAPEDVMSRSVLVDALVDNGRPKEAIEAARLAFEEQKGRALTRTLGHLYYARSRAYAAENEADREFDDLARAAYLEPDAYAAEYADAQSASVEGSGLDRLLPESRLAQAGLGVVIAAGFLTPLCLILAWWRRRKAEREQEEWDAFAEEDERLYVGIPSDTTQTHRKKSLINI